MCCRARGATLLFVITTTTTSSTTTTTTTKVLIFYKVYLCNFFSSSRCLRRSGWVFFFYIQHSLGVFFFFGSFHKRYTLEFVLYIWRYTYIVLDCEKDKKKNKTKTNYRHLRNFSRFFFPFFYSSFIFVVHLTYIYLHMWNCWMSRIFKYYYFIILYFITKMLLEISSEFE